MIQKKYTGETCVIVATGPSLSRDQILITAFAHAHNKCKVITVNNAYKLVPFADAHISYNKNWWDHYTQEHDLIELRDRGCEMWTQHQEIAESFKINYIKTIKSPMAKGSGLSKNQNYIHENHGSGPMAINLATLYGFKKLLLIGHDLKYPKEYSGTAKITGGKRHFFGEYPKSMQHWPHTRVNKGVLCGMIEYYGTMVNDLNDLNVEVINCTPESALKCFKLGNLEDELK